MLMKRKYPTKLDRYLVNRLSLSQNQRSGHGRHFNTLEYLLEPIPVFQHYCFDKEEPQIRRDIYLDKITIVLKLSRFCFKSVTYPLNIILRKPNVDELYLTAIHQLTNAISIKLVCHRYSTATLHESPITSPHPTAISPLIHKRFTIQHWPSLKFTTSRKVFVKTDFISI